MTDLPDLLAQGRRRPRHTHLAADPPPRQQTTPPPRRRPPTAQGPHHQEEPQVTTLAFIDTETTGLDPERGAAL